MNRIKPVSPFAERGLWEPESSASEPPVRPGLAGRETGLDLQDPLMAYSQGRLARADAIRLLGLRDHAELLVALGDADLPMPTGTPAEIEEQAATFAMLWRS